jgi:2,3,4,5-tetrahydropyridine-2-carboxylate N-succinyltransferase
VTLETEHRRLIEAAFVDRALLGEGEYVAAVHAVVDALDRGEARVASPPDVGAGAGSGASAGAGIGATEGEWTTHAWIMQAILLYFAVREMYASNAGPQEYFDKIPLKKNLAKARVRIVPPSAVRHGAFLEPGVVMMPSFVNIGARVGAGTMVDTWATVGSCAQIGKGVHLSGGVGIGGVLEPPGARPVIVEDGAFVGSRVVVVEGVRVGREAVIGAGVILTSSVPILDVTGPEVVEHRGYVPPRSIVIPGVRTKRFPAGEFGVPCPLIIGKRSAATDLKVSLNAALRDFTVPV